MTDLFTLLPASVLLPFLAAGIALNLTPGADVLFATATGLGGGPRAGAAAGLGVGLGGLVHVGLAALGLAALIAAHPGLLTAIRYAGAAYLAWLAVRAWAAARPEAPAARSLTPARALRQGFVTNLFNPKVILFILAFLPQFADPARGPVGLQIALLGALFTLTGTLVTAGYGALAGRMGAALAPRLGALNRVSALLIGALALKLAGSR